MCILGVHVRSLIEQEASQIYVIRPHGMMLRRIPFAASEALLRESLNLRCRAWGSDCPIRERTLYLLAETLHTVERDSEARPALEESIAIAERLTKSAARFVDILRKCRPSTACRVPLAGGVGSVSSQPRHCRTSGHVGPGRCRLAARSGDVL